MSRPICEPGDYVVTIYDRDDNALEHIHHTGALYEAKEMHQAPEGGSIRVDMTVYNSKYNVRSGK